MQTYSTNQLKLTELEDKKSDVKINQNDFFFFIDV